MRAVKNPYLLASSRVICHTVLLFVLFDRYSVHRALSSSFRTVPADKCCNCSLFSFYHESQQVRIEIFHLYDQSRVSHFSDYLVDPDTV